MLPSSLAAAILLGGLPQAQEAAVAPPRSPVLTHPTWARPPALRAPAGRTHSRLVEVDCGLGPGGSLTGCEIAEVIPEDDEAGEIALRALGPARLDPQSVRDLPPNVRVRFPLQIWMGL